MDFAISNDTPFYYSKVVALNLPIYQNPDFFVDYTILNGVLSPNPNIVIPKTLQYYMENIIRQANPITPHITELAFFKFLNFCGLSFEDALNCVTYFNSVAISSFNYVENNNGWCEVLAQIPNLAGKLTLATKTLDLPNIIGADQTDGHGLFDNGNSEFIFTNAKNIIDFENSTIENVDNSFDFNTLLIFYRDKDNVDKLHGINFINNFDNKVTYFDLPTYTQATNDARSIGYQFKFNMKTVNNEASLILIEEQNSAGMWGLFSETLTSLNSFLTVHALQNPL